MSIDPELREWYNAKLREYLDRGYAVKLLPSRIHSPRGLVWYLPHFVIQNKRRLVFDAAAKVDGKSLLNILLHFRQGKVGVCADIQEMFHRVHQGRGPGCPAIFVEGRPVLAHSSICHSGHDIWFPFIAMLLTVRKKYSCPTSQGSISAGFARNHRLDIRG